MSSKRERLTRPGLSGAVGSASCGSRFTTYERLEQRTFLWVVKKDVGAGRPLTGAVPQGNGKVL
ncbi:MAG: hypothetical protein MZU95_07775 [Desulfomicrobium escambiense]|nr:hypothetical protein [Desulfomicrobium escambiense]